MAELNSFQSIGSLPVWALPNAPDMMKWQWQPPKQNLWSPAPEATLSPLEAPTPPEVAVVLEVEAAALVQTDHMCAFLAELTEMHIGSFKSAEEYRSKFENLVDRIAMVITKGELTGSGTAETFMVAHEHLLIACRVFPELRLLFPYLMLHVARGIKDAKKRDHRFYIPKAHFWEVWLDLLSDCEITVATTELLAFVVKNLRTRNHATFSSTLLCILRRYFQLWKSADIHGEPATSDHAEISQTLRLTRIWLGRARGLLKTGKSDLVNGQIQGARFYLHVAQKYLARTHSLTLKLGRLMSDDTQLTELLAEALNTRDPRFYRWIYTGVTATFKGSVDWSRSRYNWLRMLAQMPRIRTNQLDQLLRLFKNDDPRALSSKELCELLLLHWSGQGLIEDINWTRRVWNEIRGRDDGIALAALAMAANKTSKPVQCTAMFWKLWTILRVRGGPKKLLHQIYVLSKSRKLSPGFLKRLAWTSHNHRIPMLLHSILVQQAGKEHNFWWPPFWDKFAAMLSRQGNDPLVDPFLFARKMINLSDEKEVCAKSYHQTKNGETMTKEAAESILKIRQVLECLVRARQLSDREALRHVTHFTNALADKQGQLSARDLSYLTSVIMRTLDRGKCGSVERLRWYLGVIYKHLGEQSCIRVGVIIKRRRQANWMIWRRLLREKTEEQILEVQSATPHRDFKGGYPERSRLLWSGYMDYDIQSSVRRSRAARRYTRLLMENPSMNTVIMSDRNGVGITEKSVETISQAVLLRSSSRTFDKGDIMEQAHGDSLTQAKNKSRTANNEDAFDALREHTRVEKVDRRVSF